MEENAPGGGISKAAGRQWRRRRWWGRVDERVHSLSKKGLGLSQDFHNGIKAERVG